MSRLVEIDALELPYGYCEDASECYIALRSLPSIDIVRCKECKYKRLYDGETKYYYCALEDRPNRQWGVDDTDFCSWGERKDNETDRR